MLLGFGFVLDRKETTETQRLAEGTQGWEQTQNHISQTIFLQYCVGTCKTTRVQNNLS